MTRTAPPKSIVDVRRYWDARPCNIRHSTKPVGSREYFDEVESRKYFVEPHIPAFAEFDRWRGKRVLEVGCGIGTDSVNFARAGAELTAVDLSSESLQIARQRAEVMGVDDRIEFITANAEELSSAVSGGPYDLVYSFGVIHHTPNPERALCRDADAHRARRHTQDDGLPSPLVEGAVDGGGEWAGRLSEDGRADREVFRGTDRMSGHVRLQPARRARSSSNGTDLRWMSCPSTISSPTASATMSSTAM